jgi:predicted nuclease of predicted toxin-antitoxin system
MNLLIDMNLTPDWRRHLAQFGHVAVHWNDVGDPKALDPEVMEWARLNDHIVLTHDLDFGRLLALTKATGPSVIQLRCNEPLPSVMGRMLVDVLRDHEQDFKDGAVAVLDVARSRIRILPI